MSSDNSSSLKAYVDSASGAVQSAIGSLTGSTADKAQGEQTRANAATSQESSHTVGKFGPIAVSPSGGVSQDDPARAEGSWNQTVGSGKEMLGNLVGSQDLKNQGIQQNAAGKGQEAQGQLSDLGNGMGDRVQGAIGAGLAGLTGDKEGQAKYQDMHDDGKTKLRSAQRDIEREAQ
ncbi:hypothetical protein MMC18_006658 [Xylographa bjoerkii]|nr:hypothetical protein [Xylographa bjoerkii]